MKFQVIFSILHGFLITIDVFHIPAHMLFLSSKTISTRPSIFASLVLYALLFVSFFKSDFWKKENPKITDQIVNYGSVLTTLNSQNFALNLWVWDDAENYPFLDPSYGSIEVSLKYYNISQDAFIATPIPLRNCTFEEVGMDPTGSFCLDQDVQLKLNESEIWKGDYSYLNIKLLMCSNDSVANNSCQDTQTIWNFFKGKYFTVGHKTYSFNFRNYNDPAKIISLNTRDLIIDPNLYQSFEYSLMEIEILQDASLIFDNGEVLFQKYNQEDPTKLNTEIYFRDLTDNNNNGLPFESDPTLIEIGFYPNVDRREITRNYQKLVDVLSGLGGLASFLNVFGVIVASFSANAKILKKMHKHIYGGKSVSSATENFEIEKEHPNLKLNEKSFTNSVEMSLRNKKDLEEISLKPILKSPDPSKKEEKHIEINLSKLPASERTKSFLKVNRKIEKLSTFDYLKLKFRQILKKPLSRKEQTMELLEKAYFYDFDILQILKRLKNLETLKSVLFGERQKELWEIIEKKDFSLIPEKNDRKNDETDNILKYYEEKQKNFSLSKKEI